MVKHLACFASFRQITAWTSDLLIYSCGIWCVCVCVCPNSLWLWVALDCLSQVLTGAVVTLCRAVVCGQRQRNVFLKLCSIMIPELREREG